MEGVDKLTGLGDERRLMKDMGPAAAGPASPMVLTMFDLEGFKHYNDSYGRSCGDVLLRRLARRLADAVEAQATAYRMQGDEFAVLQRGSVADAAEVVARAASALIDLGEGFMIRAWHGSVALPADTRFPGDALKLADQRLQQHRHDPRADATPELARRAAAGSVRATPAIEAGALAEEVGVRMGFSGGELSDLVAAAELRDVGMMAVPDSILLSDCGLALEDRRLVRLHTVVGERLLTANFGMGDVAAIVRSSHERFDGRGYPDGLAGDRIALAARIVFACGVLSDLTAPRPHRDPLPADIALAEVRRGAGTQFDPWVVEVLARAVGERARDGASPAEARLAAA